MRVHVDHQTHYRFEEPQDRVIQLLRMRPCDNDHQTVLTWRFDVDCDARLKAHFDGFGNEVTMLYADGPVDSITITVTGEVLTDPADGIVTGTEEPLPPDLFLRSTPRTRADADIRAFALDAAGDGDMIAQLHRINLAIGKRFTLDAARGDLPHSAAETMADKTASVRDMAQLFVACARVLEAPARYVSGYRAIEQTKAEAAQHGWAEIFVGGLGWVGFDPSAGISPDERYVRCAVGLDSADAAPVAGSRSGGGDEELDVSVQASVLGAGQS